MNSGIEYLVKYSVAPPPSRDYYGLKILEDEVILYLWKISHGPHRAPIVYRSKFAEFGQEKLLQDEIRHGFGAHVLSHVTNIAEGNRNTLLTLPRSLIGRISRYLAYKDIVKLSSLSRIANEIFDTDLVWEILYKRDTNTKISAQEKEEAKICGWKRLYKDIQMQTSTKHRRNFLTQSSIKHEIDAKTDKSSLRIINASKPISKTISTVNITTKQHPEFSNTNLTTISLSKMSSDIRFRDQSTKTEDEKSLPPKKNSRNLHRKSNVNEKNIKNEDYIIPKSTMKESRNACKHGDGLSKESENPEKCIDKNNSVETTSQEEKIKYVAPKTSSVSKSTVKKVKSSSHLSREFLGNRRSKMEVKPKKAAVTSSEIFKNDKTLFENPYVVKSDNVDLADLLEASLKKIRSPRSIFDYDFSCMQRTDITGDSSKVRHEILNVDRSKQQKPIQRNIKPAYFSGKIPGTSKILEKLSAISEPHSEASIESSTKDTKITSKKSDGLLSKKYTKGRVELGKSLNVKKSDSVFLKDRAEPRTSFRNKCSSLRKISSINEKVCIAKDPLRTSGLSEAHTLNNSKSKKGLSAKSSKIGQDLQRRRCRKDRN